MFQRNNRPTSPPPTFFEPTPSRIDYTPNQPSTARVEYRAIPNPVGPLDLNRPLDTNVKLSSDFFERTQPVQPVQPVDRVLRPVDMGGLMHLHDHSGHSHHGIYLYTFYIFWMMKN